MSPVSASFSISGSSIRLCLDFDFFFFELLDFELFSFDVFLVGEFERDRDRDLERDLGVVELGGGETRRWFVERFEFRFEALWFWITSYDTV